MRWCRSHFRRTCGIIRSLRFFVRSRVHTCCEVESGSAVFQDRVPRQEPAPVRARTSRSRGRDDPVQREGDSELDLAIIWKTRRSTAVFGSRDRDVAGAAYRVPACASTDRRLRRIAARYPGPRSPAGSGSQHAGATSSPPSFVSSKGISLAPEAASIRARTGTWPTSSDRLRSGVPVVDRIRGAAFSLRKNASWVRRRTSRSRILFEQGMNLR